jgi:hypothetical protein
MHFSRALAFVAAIATLSACASNTPIPNPQASWAQATGQIQSSGGKVPIVGEIVIRHDRENFLAEVTKGPGLPLLRIYGKGAHGEQVTARGALARGSWSGSPEKAPAALKTWAALPAVFQWANAKASGDRNASLALSGVKTDGTTVSKGLMQLQYEVGKERIVCRLQQ